MAFGRSKTEPTDPPTGQPFDTPTSPFATAVRDAPESGGRKKKQKPDKPPKGLKPDKPPRAAKEPKEKPEKQARPDGDSPSARAWPGPSKPSAVLVPRYVRERRAAQRTARTVVFGLLGVALLVVSGLGYSFISAKTAENDRDVAISNQAGAQSRVDALSPIAAYYDGLIARQANAVAVMQRDLDLSRVSNAIYATASRANVVVTSINITTTSQPCEGSNPFEASLSMGCLNVTIAAPNSVAVGNFVDALNADEALFNQAFATNLAVSGDTDATSVDVNYSVEALSLRYVPEAQHEKAKSQIVPGYVPTDQAPAENPQG